MQKLHFTITINAPREHVWNTMLGDATYRQWTEAFAKGSYYEGSWEQGSPIKFLAPNDDGTLAGMFSRIAENRPHEFISIQHLGEIKDGVEDASGKRWEAAFENYTLKEVDGGTEVRVDMDSEDGKLAAMFTEMWPKALDTLKRIAEQS